MNRIKIDPERVIGPIDRNIFGGFAEHLGRCIYGGIYEPGSPLSDSDGLRKDVLDALKRLRMPLIRYPGGNFASGYRWWDGVGPAELRPSRTDLAWHDLESNRFGTNEFITFCRKIETEPYLVVNCGDGSMREARDWVEYCNGTVDSSLVKMRRQHGFPGPHNVKYWSIGNEVDGHWQIGYKTPEEYARTFTEYGKVMKWVDPSIKLVASVASDWGGEWEKRTQLLLEQAGDLVDFLSLHWYIGNKENNFSNYMAISELLEKRLSGFETLVKTITKQRKITRPIYLAVDEWNVWYRTFGAEAYKTKLEEIYSLEDALATAIQLNAFIRHADSVKMANLAQIVNVIAPVFTRPGGMVLQTIYFPFMLYSRTCGNIALDVQWEGDTFTSNEYKGVRTLDVTATLDEVNKQLIVYVVNRGEKQEAVTSLELTNCSFKDKAHFFTINGPDIKAENTFASPGNIITRDRMTDASGHNFQISLEPHSVTAIVCEIE
jgi:alpha-L-arabinofuranosidase